MTLLVLEQGALSPVLNMATDLALFEDRAAWLRFYARMPAAISIGYFQSLEDFHDLEGSYPLLRRPTGGGAILHADEITFSLALPASAFPPGRTEGYGIVNKAVQEAVGSPRLMPPSEPAPKGSDPGSARWCFASATGLDLVLEDGRKVFGSAQRRSRSRVLHHGSLVLSRHPETPFVGSLLGEDPSTPAFRTELVERLKLGLAEVLGL
ncbi:MAG: biotin/lipoate A/B protein ligase family protein, partial [Planctomycetota bacterium]